MRPHIKLEEAYLAHILLHLTSGDADTSILTTFLNSWFAHYAGGPFVQSGAALWLSRPSTKKATAGKLHAISRAARAAMSRGSIDEVVIDHVLPSAQLLAGLKARHLRSPFTWPDDLRPYLARRFTLALITKTEHNGQLAPWKATMPDGWCDDAFDADDATRYARYIAGGIIFDIQVRHT